MLRRFFKGIVALALAAAILPASAATQNTYNYRGESAYGVFNMVEGCIATDVLVYASEQSSFGNTADYASSGATVYLLRRDVCTDTLLLNATGYADGLLEQDFDTERQLTSATLKTTVNVYDWNTGQSMPLTVDVTWAGNGELTRDVDHYHYKSEGMMMNAHYNGTSRPALLSGSISDGTTNYIEGATTTGTILDAHNGVIVVQ